MISILILTKDEQANLTGCLKSVSWSDDIHVYDSFSTDRTVAIAESFGATVTQRKFDNWAAHQNWGLQNIRFKYPWIFYIDADERMTAELVTAIQKKIREPGENVAFRIQRRDFFLGTWLRHVQASPFYMRLFRPNKMRYERLVNPISIADGPVDAVSGYLDHFPFSRGISHWLDRHNSYSTLEAMQIVADRQTRARWSLRKAFVSSDFHERRYHQKQFFYHLPMRPVFKFIGLYFAKRGFLDGNPGLTYALLQSIYEYMIVLKVREIEHSSSVPSIL